MVLLTNILSPAQYLAVALHRPLIDPALAWGDSLMGVNVSLLAEWTREHPLLNLVLAASYSTLLVQLGLIISILGLWMRDRAGLREYLFHFHVCAVVTVLALAIFPAACAFQHYGFESTLDQTRFIAHFTAVRSGTMRTIRLDDLEGLISTPSFHVAGACMTTWALRRRAVLLPIAVGVNSLLIASTVLSGAHHLIDVIVTGALFAISVFAWRHVVDRTGLNLASPGAAPALADALAGT